VALTNIEKELSYLDDLQADLKKQRDEIREQLGKPSLTSKIKSKKQPHGTLIQAYTSALKSSLGGMTSSELVEWVE
jgi:hypothetical protein